MFVNITITEYQELLRKATIYDTKKRELESAGYVPEIDRVLFDIPKSEPTEASNDDDF